MNLIKIIPKERKTNYGEEIDDVIILIQVIMFGCLVVL